MQQIAAAAGKVSEVDRLQPHFESLSLNSAGLSSSNPLVAKLAYVSRLACLLTLETVVDRLAFC